MSSANDTAHLPGPHARTVVNPFITLDHPTPNALNTASTGSE